MVPPSAGPGRQARTGHVTRGSWVSLPTASRGWAPFVSLVHRRETEAGEVPGAGWRSGRVRDPHHPFPRSASNGLSASAHSLASALSRGSPRGPTLRPVLAHTGGGTGRGVRGFGPRRGECLRPCRPDRWPGLEVLNGGSFRQTALPRAVPISAFAQRRPEFPVPPPPSPCGQGSVCVPICREGGKQAPAPHL